MNRNSAGAFLLVLALTGCTSMASDDLGGFGKSDRIDDDVAIGGGLEGDQLVDLAFENESALDPWAVDHPVRTNDYSSVDRRTLDDGEQPPSEDVVTYVFDDSGMTDEGLPDPEVPAEP